jgi:tRNA(Ile)-lysidine synthase
MELSPDYLAHQLSRYPPAPRYWLAFSGGCDSRVLLALLADLHQRDGLPIAVVHVNHGLHAEADAWGAQCEQVCQEYGLACAVLPVTVEKLRGQSPEASARRARYAALETVMGEGDGILVAHHRDDQAETVLLQLLRGAGVNGLAAMPRCSAFGRGWLARPLLDVSRDTIRAYARHRNLQWIHDPSNDERCFDRNFLRHELIPVLTSRWPAAAVALARVADHQADARQCLADLAALDLAEVDGSAGDPLPVRTLQALSFARQRNLLRYWLVERCDLPVPDWRHLQRILDEVLTASPDATPCVTWPGAEVRRYRGRLYAAKPIAAHDPGSVFDWDLRTELALPSLDGCLRPQHSTDGGLDPRFGTLGSGLPPVTVRFRQGGERCRPAGRGHHHALKKLFQEWGVPPWRRDRVPLVYIGDELAQVVGHCICDPFQTPRGRPGITAKLVSALDQRSD